jgi:outer membrane protein assembly factor BamB
MELLAIRRWRALTLGAALAAGLGTSGGAARAADVSTPPGSASSERAVGETRGALQPAWRAELGRNLGRWLAVDDSSVAVATRERDCALLRLEDGSAEWHTRRGAAIPGGLALAGSRVLGVSDGPESELFCLERADGREAWRVPFGEAWAPPVAGDTTVYAAAVTGEVRCVSREDGRTLWSYAAPSFVRAPLLLAQDLLLVPTQGDSLIALDAGSGAVRWGLAPGGALYGSLAVAGGRAWCLSYEGTLTAFDLPSGVVHGRTQLDGLFRGGLGGPHPLLALATDGRLHALDPHSLRPFWVRDLGAIAQVAPTSDRELVWVALEDGSVRALRSRDGRDVAELTVLAPFAAPVRVRGRSILISAGGGKLIAYRWFGGQRSTGRGLPGVGTIPIPLILSGGFAAPALGSVGSPPARAPAPDASRRLGTAPEPSRGDSHWARWVWTAGWVIGSASALWMQNEADDAYEAYRVHGRPDERERAWDRAARYDRGVVAAWIASEACFALAVRAWLDHASEAGRAR